MWCTTVLLQGNLSAQVSCVDAPPYCNAVARVTFQATQNRLVTSVVSDVNMILHVLHFDLGAAFDLFPVFCRTS
eukprot:6198808-Pleurochrysis_carterae.AAC.1